MWIEEFRYENTRAQVARRRLAYAPGPPENFAKVSNLDFAMRKRSEFINRNAEIRAHVDGRTKQQRVEIHVVLCGDT